METVIGVIGPHDLVEPVGSVCAEQPNVRVELHPYTHEASAPLLVEKHNRDVDAWLFTGVIPYTLSTDVLARPAAYVDYNGATLLTALVRLLRDGHDISWLTIDTLAPSEVREVLAEAGLHTDQVHALAFRPGLTSETFIDFHRSYHTPETVAITCVSTVFEELRHEMTTWRLVPSAHSVRIAVRNLLLMIGNQVSEDAQVALAIIRADPPLAPMDEPLQAELGRLAGTATPYDDGILVVTTRGRLLSATDQLTAAPMLRRLAATRDHVHIGFGIGRSAAEAELLARRALARASRHGPYGAVASLRHEIDVVLEAPSLEAQTGSQPSPDLLDEAGIGVIAARVGLSVSTVRRLSEIARSTTGEVTARDLATKLGIQQRSARRIAQRLVLAGLADRAGSLAPSGSGRPQTLYRLLL